MIKACLIGVSGYGNTHYQMLLEQHRLGMLQLIGAAIINQKEEEEKCTNLQKIGCQLFEDYAEMHIALKDEANLCLIPTGTPLHKVMTISALEANMHVLVEKPAAGCIEDVQLMHKAAQKANRIVAVGYQHLYSTSALATKDAILNKTIGTIKSLKCLVTWPRSHQYYQRNHWAGKLNINATQVNDSPINNAVAHELMMMLFLAGLTKSTAATPVVVESQLYRANAIESADSACLRVETKEGIPISFYATHACLENFGPEIHIEGSEGSITMTHKEIVIQPNSKDNITLKVEDEHVNLITSMLDVIHQKPAFICDLTCASKQSMVISAVHENALIQNVTSETLHSEGKPSKTHIPGIESAMREAFMKNKLLDTTIVPWAIDSKHSECIRIH